MDNKWKLSTCIVSYNNHNLFDRMSTRLDEVSDQMVIADQSTDKESVDFFRSKSDIYIKTRKKGYADPDRQFVIESCSNEFILMLDLDEYLSDDLVDFIKMIKTLPLNDVSDIFWIEFKNFVVYNGKEHDIERILGKDPHPRLFKRGSVKWPSEMHTFPTRLSRREMVIPHTIIHKRNYADLIKSHELRSVAGTDQSRQQEAQFISALRQLIMEGA